MAGEENSRISKIVPRGFLKAYILIILKKKPLHGYALIKGIEEKTGFWRPSPGTIYPLLGALVKEGYLEVSSDSKRRKLYRLTRKGVKLSKEFERSKDLLHKHISNLLCQMTPDLRKEIIAFFDSATEEYLKGNLACLMHQTFSFLLQISKDPEKSKEACKIISQANKKLMALLEKSR